ncbi:MAG: hypothetical protein GVY07_04345 [Bacteroidetes bacterium]|nr:hypothetical protein [Bacteroidota bacterium]
MPNQVDGREQLSSRCPLAWASRWSTPSLPAGGHGSRIRRFIIHHFNRLFHWVELSQPFILGSMAAGK